MRAGARGPAGKERSMPKKKEERVCETVVCPHCGREYHPSEIFYPDFLGKASRLIRDGAGKIIWAEFSEEPSLEEKFVCEDCGKPFVATAEVSYSSRPEEAELDFEEEEVSLF